MENPIKSMDDLGVNPYFWKHPYGGTDNIIEMSKVGFYTPRLRKDKGNKNYIFASGWTTIQTHLRNTKEFRQEHPTCCCDRVISWVSWHWGWNYGSIPGHRKRGANSGLQVGSSNHRMIISLVELFGRSGWLEFWLEKQRLSRRSNERCCKMSNAWRINHLGFKIETLHRHFSRLFLRLKPWKSPVSRLTYCGRSWCL